jgi:hypothetical protein
LTYARPAGAVLARVHDTAFRLVRPVLTAHVARGLNVDEYVWDSMQEPEVFEPSPKLKK